MRKYYSQRNGKAGYTLDIVALRTIFSVTIKSFKSRGYFDEYLGKNCQDGFLPGMAGEDVEGDILKILRKDNLWPLTENILIFSNEDIFDLVEFFFDHISAPLEEGSYNHSWNDCGKHFIKFDRMAGRSEFIDDINQALNDFDGGYELSTTGEVLSLGEPEFKALFDASLPVSESNLTAKVNGAITQFKRYGSTLDDRAHSVRDLADCLEYLRPKLKSSLDKKDENDLFNIVNNFKKA